jgi:hypothetical protein
MSKKTIVVYGDPYTKLDQEGHATIVRDLGFDAPGIHRYLIHFRGDLPGQNVERIVVEEKSAQEASDD